MESFGLFITRLSLSQTQEECLRTAYVELTKKYRGYRVRTYLRFWELFQTDIEKLWARQGFIHCTHMNRLLREVLVKSGQFHAEDVRTHWTIIWGISPHQYTEVRLKSGQKVFVDIWGKTYGIPFGNYAHGFNSTFLAISNEIQ